MITIIVALLLAALVSTTIALFITDSELNRIDRRIKALEKEKLLKDTELFYQLLDQEKGKP